MKGEGVPPVRVNGKADAVIYVWYSFKGVEGGTVEMGGTQELYGRYITIYRNNGRNI